MLQILSGMMLPPALLELPESSALDTKKNFAKVDPQKQLFFRAPKDAGGSTEVTPTPVSRDHECVYNVYLRSSASISAIFHPNPTVF